jgi:hypothetical protein
MDSPPSLASSEMIEDIRADLEMSRFPSSSMRPHE